MSAAIKQAGVCGWPISHSLSPMIMKTWLDEAGIEGRYSLYEIHRDNFEDQIYKLARSGLAGMNITLPYKQAALKLANKASHAAQEIGAANLLKFGSDADISADNTDIIGIKEALAGDNETGPAVLIGAGGAARAGLYYLAQQNRDIRLVNRTVSRAAKLASDMGVEAKIYDFTDPNAFNDASLVINATSLGMNGQNDLSCPFERCASTCIVFDMVYTPINTGFLKLAQAAQLETRDGLSMLIAQAKPSFEMFYGVKSGSTDQVRTLLINRLESQS